MALSDDLLTDKKRLELVRERLRRLVDELGVSASFLVDEAGAPFASTGHVEFTLPHPIADLDQLLTALVGESTDGGKPTAASPYLVTRAGRRAILVLVVESPLDRKAHDEFLRAARELSVWL